MKKLLVVLFAILSAFNMNAQEGSEHFKFKGIEIKGSIDSFANSLAKQGYTIKSHNDADTRILTGKFANRECTIALLGTPNTNTIWKVVVMFDKEYSSWYSIKSDFESLKSSFISKYGTPSGDYHFFSYPYEEGDGYEMTAIRADKCTYAAFFNLSHGSISIKISKFKSINICYEDELGSQIFSKEKSSIISNDI